MAIPTGSLNTYISNINENVLLFFLLNPNIHIDLTYHKLNYDYILTTLNDEINNLIKINVEKMLQTLQPQIVYTDVVNTIIKSYISAIELKSQYNFTNIVDGMITNKGPKHIQEFIDKHNIVKTVYPLDHPADIVIKHNEEIFGISLKQTKGKKKIGWKNPGLGTLNKVVNKTFNTNIEWNNEVNVFRNSSITVLEQMRKNNLLVDENLVEDFTKITKTKLKYDYVKPSLLNMYNYNEQRWATPNSICSFMYAMGKFLQESYNTKILNYYANQIKYNHETFLHHLTDYWFMCKNQYPNYCKLTALGNKLEDFIVDIEHLYCNDIYEQLHNNVGLAYAGKTGFIIGDLREQKGLIYIRSKWNSMPVVTSFKFTAAPSPQDITLLSIDNFLDITYNVISDKCFTIDNVLQLQEYFISEDYKL